MSTRKLVLSMQITVDGYIAGPNDTADWLMSGDEEWKDLFQEIDAADTYLLGRKMYPLYSKYWQSVLHNPQSAPYELKFAQVADKSKHIVFTSGDFKPDWNNTVVAHDLAGEIDRLKKEEGKNMIAWGGSGFATSLINHNLVDEYRFEVNPTILAAGKRLFDDVNRRSKLELVSSKTMDSGMIIVRYRPGK